MYTKPLELIVSDLWGPLPNPSHNGFKDYVTFVDAYAKYLDLFS